MTYQAWGRMTTKKRRRAKRAGKTTHFTRQAFLGVGRGASARFLASVSSSSAAAYLDRGASLQAVAHSSGPGGSPTFLMRCAIRHGEAIRAPWPAGSVLPI